MAGLLLKIDLFEPDQERTTEWPFSSAIVCDAVDKWVDDAEIKLGETDRKGRTMDNKKVTQFLNVVEKLMKHSVQVELDTRRGKVMHGVPRAVSSDDQTGSWRKATLTRGRFRRTPSRNGCSLRARRPFSRSTEKPEALRVALLHYAQFFLGAELKDTLLSLHRAAAANGESLQWLAARTAILGNFARAAPRFFLSSRLPIGVRSR